MYQSKENLLWYKSKYQSKENLYWYKPALYQVSCLALYQSKHCTRASIVPLPALYQSKFSFTLVERRKFHTAIQIFKSIHQKLPSYLHNIFHYSRDITGHIGRNINRLFVPRVNNNYGKRSFYYRGAMIWNSLPSTVTEATNLSKFVRLYHDKFS